MAKSWNQLAVRPIQHGFVELLLNRTNFEKLMLPKYSTSSDMIVLRYEISEFAIVSVRYMLYEVDEISFSCTIRTFLHIHTRFFLVRAPIRCLRYGLLT